MATQRAIYGRLAGDTILNTAGTYSGTKYPGLGTPAQHYAKNIYYMIAAQDSGLPFVQFNKQSNATVNAFAPMVRATGPGGTNQNLPSIENETWSVKAVVRDSDTYNGVGAMTAVTLLAERIDFLLNDYLFGGGQIDASRTVLSMRRETELDYMEEFDGVIYRHAGSTFRLFHTPT